MITVSFILASFVRPEMIGVNPQSMLWLLPLVAAISIVYKTTKIPAIKFTTFLKEVVILFSSIVIFMIITAGVLYTMAWLLTE
ncbi:MAG: hypothetical protein JW787_13750 [Sedimentisphaerales bacterium]|nr:hypothetical protein [Sedimentisphaerales bacterium]